MSQFLTLGGSQVPLLNFGKGPKVSCPRVLVPLLYNGTKPDSFIFSFGNISSAAVNLPVTKRNILKISSTFFDPLNQSPYR